MIISGFYGKTDLDQLKIDMLVDNIDDIIKPLFGGAVLATAEEKVRYHLKVSGIDWLKIINSCFLFSYFALIHPQLFLQEAVLKNWIEVHSPPKLAQMESILKENNGGDGWLVGDDVSSLGAKKHYYQSPNRPSDFAVLRFTGSESAHRPQ